MTTDDTTPGAVRYVLSLIEDELGAATVYHDLGAYPDHVLWTDVVTALAAIGDRYGWRPEWDMTDDEQRRTEGKLLRLAKMGAPDA